MSVILLLSLAGGGPAAVSMFQAHGKLGTKREREREREHYRFLVGFNVLRISVILLLYLVWGEPSLISTEYVYL